MISPQQLMQELVSDMDGTRTKYDGKLLQLSGTVESKVEPGSLNPTRGVVFTGISAKTRSDANVEFFAFDPSEAEAFDSIQPGQSITLVCRFKTLSPKLLLVKSCRKTG